MIFCDMDNVLVDFDRECKRRFGQPPQNIPRPDLWENVKSIQDYWYTLPKMNDADKLIEFLLRHNFCILTGLPIIGYEKAEKEKRRWLKTNYQIENNVICCLSKDKQKHGCKNDILIDDLDKNIAHWEEMGGIGILHISAVNTIQKLQQLGYK